MKTADLRDLKKEGNLVAQMPFTIDLAQNNVAAYKISAPGKENQIWVFLKGAGEKIDAKVNLNPAGEGAAKGPDSDRKPKMNSLLRLVMASYKALSEKDNRAAREFADQAIKVDPDAAAPLILRGLALMQEGNKDDARAAFKRAKVIDPEDKNIDKLLKEVQ